MIRFFSMLPIVLCESHANAVVSEKSIGAVLTDIQDFAARVVVTPAQAPHRP